MSSRQVAQVWRISRVLTILALAGAIGGCAMCSCPTPPKREVQDGPYPVVYAKIPPKIDGTLDDPVWKYAVPHTTFYTFKKYGERVNVAKSYLAWDKDNLYFAIDINDKDLYAVQKENDKELCEADVAELFVKPSDDHLDIYELEFNFWGALWYLHFLSLGGGGADRFTVTDHPGMVVRATYRGTPNDPNDMNDGYTITAAIPLKTFERGAPGGPKAGDKWKFNVAGYDFSCYREEALLFTTCDGQTKEFKEYAIYPQMVFLAPGETSPKTEW